MRKRICAVWLLVTVIFLQTPLEGVALCIPSSEKHSISPDTDIDTDIGDADKPDPIKPDTNNESSQHPPNASVTITVSDRKLTIPKGKSVSITAKVFPPNTPITWKASDPSIAEVKNGKITGKRGGKTIVSAQAGGETAECTVTVAEVSWNAKTAVLQTGTSSHALQIEKKYPKEDKVKTYKSSNPKIVKIDQKGRITAGKKTGKAVLTVTMKSGASAACKITVQKKAVQTKKLALSPKKLSLKKGEKAKLRATRKPVTATEKITWESSDRAVATVDSKGIVKARKKGKARLTAKAGNGKKAVCLLTVK